MYREHAERMLLASYVAGLIIVPGRQVRYASPVSVEKAIRIAVLVQEAEWLEKLIIERVTTAVRNAVGSRTACQAEGRRTEITRSADKARASSTRNAQTKAALRCYACEYIGHFARECPSRLKREHDISLQRGRKKQTERSRRFGSPGKKTPNTTK